MSAASPKITDGAQEPSMEEILASIRRIIADDQAAKPDAEPEPGLPVRAVNDDILDLAEVAKPVRKPEPEPMPFAAPELDFADEMIDFAAPALKPEREPEPKPEPRPADAPARLQAAVEREAVERLVSKSTDESVGQAFHLLAHTVMSRNSRTIEDLVVDMLRPMLKAWLDDNLPTMVERLVRAEIERVARGR